MRPALSGAGVGRIGIAGLSVAVARPTPGWRSRVPVIQGLALCLLSSSCAVAPINSRAQQSANGASAKASATAGKPLTVSVAAASAPAPRELAAVVEVAGRGGRLNAAQRGQLLARLGRQGNASLLNRQLAALASVDRVELQANNQARLLIDGPVAFDAMFKAIAEARHTVLVHSYIVDDSALAQRLAALLLRKVAEGVSVHMLYDALGSIGTDPAYFDGLLASGVKICATNPVNPLLRPGYWNITARDHRKIISVDRRIGFTGGINISAVYSSGSFGRGGRQRARDNPKEGWRDTQIALKGPAVAVLDDLVRQTWRDQGCGPSLPPPPVEPVSATGSQVVQILPTNAREPDGRFYRMLITSIDASLRSIQLTMAYFAPGDDMIDALCDAARRGVQVQLILPEHSDFAPVLHAGRSHYQRLLEAGVKLYELQDAVLHAKTAVIDGVVSTVGSSNMDWRSFSSNSEVDALVYGEDFGREMAAMFETDLRDSKQITLAAWSGRPLLQRGKEWLARAFERWW